MKATEAIHSSIRSSKQSTGLKHSTAALFLQCQQPNRRRLYDVTDLVEISPHLCVLTTSTDKNNRIECKTMIVRKKTSAKHEHQQIYKILCNNKAI